MKTKKLLAVLTAVLMILSSFTAVAYASYEEGVPSVMSLLPLEQYDVYVTIDRTQSMPYELTSEPRYTVYVRELLADALQKYGITEPPKEVAYTTSSSSSYMTSYKLIGWNDKITLGSNSASLYFVSSNDQFDPDSKRLTVNVSVKDYYSGRYDLDLTVNTPENFTPGIYVPLTYGEILTPTLVEKGLVPEGGVYSGTVKLRSYHFDYSLGKYVEEWNEIKLTDNFEYTGSTYLDFTLDDGLGTDTSFKRVEIDFSYDDPYLAFLRSLNYDVKNADGKTVNTGNRMYTSIYTDKATMNTVRQVKMAVSAYEFENNAIPYACLGYSLGGAQVKVYSGLHYDSAELTPELDITEAVTGDKIPLEYVGVPELVSYFGDIPANSEWSIPVTYDVTLENGSNFSVPSELIVYLYDNYTVFNSSNSMVSLYSSKGFLPPVGTNRDPANYLGAYYYSWATDINNLYISVNASYRNYVMDEFGNVRDGFQNVIAAYQGHYDVMPVGGDAQDIKDTLFGLYYSYNIDPNNIKEIQTAYIPRRDSENNTVWDEVKIASVEFSVFDIYGKVHHPEFTFAYEISEALPYIPSGSTGFGVYHLNKEPIDSTGSYTSYYSIRDVADYDSYYANGYRTYLVDGEEGQLTDGTVVYPYFYTNDDKTTVYLGSDYLTAEPQETGKSPIEFESGKYWNYSVGSENHENAGNYFVTFITPYKGGSKLFVTGVDCEDTHNKDGKPTREVLFNDIYRSYGSYGDEHRIVIANVGDAPLTGIDVKLSEDAKGVKLDPYWTVTEGSVASLAPFDGIWNNLYATDDNGEYKQDENGDPINLEGILQNIAMIKLIPEEKTFTYETITSVDSSGNPVYTETEVPGFADITGTLTITADGNEPVNIELTGIAGVPRIITKDVLDGVKYVPYSSLIQTNCMYGNNNMEFTLTQGSLPDGIELMPNGELYGIPKETGTFTITVMAQYTGKIPEGYDKSVYCDTCTYTFEINDNSDENVDGVNADGQGYELTDRVSKNVTVYYTGVGANNLPTVDRVVIDSDLFRSEGSYTTEFRDFYIDGIKLEEGKDYTAVEGSTKITVLAETFGHIGISDKTTPHTLAAEFRNDKSDLRRSAQNVYLEYVEYKEEQQQGDPSLNPGTGLPSAPSGLLPTLTTGTLPSEPESFDSVTAMMSFVGTDGEPVPGLELELHSDVQYGATDGKGAAMFETVGFGRHTLYAVNTSTGKTAVKEFSIVSGFDAGFSGSVITAEVGQTVHIVFTYDGSSLDIAEVSTYVETPQQGNANDEEQEETDETAEAAPVAEDNGDEQAAPEQTQNADESEQNTVNPGTGLVLGLAPATVIACALVFIKKH